jgi:hypothetical protein
LGHHSWTLLSSIATVTACMRSATEVQHQFLKSLPAHQVRTAFSFLKLSFQINNLHYFGKDYLSTGE